MQNKRYSVFISSTFEDLKEERHAVQNVVLSAGDFPVQMETFPAVDEDQFQFIKSLIDKCDYYILIIAGRYGTPDADGISYTEKEYNYAVSKCIPVLAMIHDDRENISVKKSEKTEDGKRRLADFVAKVEKNRLRKAWATPDALRLAVREALDHAKATKPATGWVRGDTVANIDTLEELNKVRAENEKFRDTIGNMEIDLALPAIPEADGKIEIDLIPVVNGQSVGSSATVLTTWISAFPLFFNNLKWRMNDWNDEYSSYVEEDESCQAIGSAIASQIEPTVIESTFTINKNTLDRLSSYYIEAGLMRPNGSDDLFTEIAQKVARRYSIIGQQVSAFRLVEGKVEVRRTQSFSQSLDDENPF